jgi:phage terminase large subunit GpA-like protein
MRPETESTLRENARKLFARVYAECIRRRKKRLPSVWATEVRKMPAGGPISGNRVVPYEHRHMPHCVEQMDAADDPTVRIIVVWADRRAGKTNGVCMNVIGRTVTDDPGGIYSVQPTIPDVDKFSAEDAEPMIDLCLSDYFVEKKSRDAGRTKAFKKFRGGFWRIPSGGSETQFRGTTVKVVCLHEADKLERDSIHAAMGRTEGIRDAVIILESTGTIAATFDPDGKKIYNSVIEEFYDSGDRRNWFSECAECHALQVIVYEDFKWTPGRMDEARWACQQCGHEHDEDAWRRAAQNSQWFPTAGLTDEQKRDIRATHQLARAVRPEVRSYWKNGFTSLLPTSKGYRTKLHQIVAEGEAAKLSLSALKIWTQEIAAKLWDASASGEAPPAWRPIYERRQRYTKAPADALYLTAFTDVQHTRLEVLWAAWDREENMSGMAHTVIDGHHAHPETWKRLGVELARKFPHESGAEIGLGFALIDGGKWPEDVYYFLRQLAAHPIEGVSGKVRGSKGVGQHGHPIVDTTFRTIGKVLKGHNIGTWEAKDRIYERLRKTEEDEPPRIVLNESFTEEFCQQAVVETVTVTYEKGQEIRKYLNPTKARNEGLDLLVGCLAALRLRARTLNWDALRAEIDERAPREEPAQKEERRAEPVFSAPRGGFSSGWNV